MILKIKKTDIVFWQWNIICNDLDHNQEGGGTGLRRKNLKIQMKTQIQVKYKYNKKN